MLYMSLQFLSQDFALYVCLDPFLCVWGCNQLSLHKVSFYKKNEVLLKEWIFFPPAPIVCSFLIFQAGLEILLFEKFNSRHLGDLLDHHRINSLSVPTWPCYISHTQLIGYQNPPYKVKLLNETFDFVFSHLIHPMIGLGHCVDKYLLKRLLSCPQNNE